MNIINLLAAGALFSGEFATEYMMYTTLIKK